MSRGARLVKQQRSPDRLKRDHVRSRSGRDRQQPSGRRRLRLSPSESPTRPFRKSGRCARSQSPTQSAGADTVKDVDRRRSAWPFPDLRPVRHVTLLPGLHSLRVRGNEQRPRGTWPLRVSLATKRHKNSRSRSSLQEQISLLLLPAPAPDACYFFLGASLTTSFSLLRTISKVSKPFAVVGLNEAAGLPSIN